MENRPTTFRLDAFCRDGLALLSGLLHQPLNKLVNDAVREYVLRRTANIDKELSATLEELRAFRQKDPAFTRSIAAFADAEISGTHDPAEGKPVTSAGPAQARVRAVLGG